MRKGLILLVFSGHHGSGPGRPGLPCLDPGQRKRRTCANFLAIAALA
jgi:hypothetical protein